MQQHPFKSADLAGRLRAARRAAGITQQQAAARIKAARTTIVAIEQGLRPIALGELQQLARFYAAPTAALLGKQAVFVDFDPNFGRSVNRADRNVRKTCRIMSRLIGGAAELESILATQRSRAAWPRQRRLKSGNEQADAERDASRLRQDLALADAPIADLPHIIEMQLGIRIFLYPLDDKIAGMYCFDNRFGASILLNSKLTAPAAAVAAARQVGHFMVARKKGCLLQTDEKRGVRASREKNYALAFARAFLLPAKTVAIYLNDVTEATGKIEHRHVVLLAARLGISQVLLLQRLADLRLLTTKDRQHFSKCIDDIMPMSDERIDQGPFSYRTQRLHRLAAEAWERKLASEGYLSELLMVDRVRFRAIAYGCLAN